MMSQRTLVVLTVLVAQFGAACAAAVGDVEPALEAGTSDSGTFTEFAQGDVIEVQVAGETRPWFRPTLRYQGFEGRPSVRCTAFDLDRDSFLAEQRSYETVVVRGDWTHVPYTMEIQLPDEDLKDDAEMQTYKGDRVLLQCRADDEIGNASVISHEMTLGVR